MAAPTESRTPNWHRAKIAHTERKSLTQECGWKGGDRGGLAERTAEKPNQERYSLLTRTGLLMEGVEVNLFIGHEHKTAAELVP